MSTMRALEYYSKNNNLWNTSGAVYNETETSPNKLHALSGGK